ncbi:MAG: type IV toxin-antitoxin system AbiEi family antitoxin domain-containing protein [Promethearchaeota archaeon]
MNTTDLKRRFKKKNWYLTKNELNSLDVSDYIIGKFLQNNTIIKISSGLYRWKNLESSENEDLLDIFQIEPTSVLCLYSAMQFHHLSSFISTKYYIAIPREKWIRKNLDNYPVVIKKWTGLYFDLGIDLIKIEGSTFRIYNLEKTVCDCVRFRNEIGLNTLKEILSTYFNSKKNDIPRLMLYAEKLHIDKILKNFAGMIV